LVIEAQRARLAAKEQKIRFEDEAVKRPVVVDPTVTTQVFENLISNAIKYSPPGKTITVRLTEEASGVRFEVRDEGPGLSVEDHRKLFGKFARLSAKPTGGEHATGLGLSIVKRMVEAMNGKVWCESELGKGASFMVELPFRGASGTA
jgi:signal transduction histidine kinase